MLPQRRVHGYDLVPRLLLEDGELADPPDFMPRRGGERLVVRIEKLLIETAVMVARRARTNKEPVTLFAPITRATLADAAARDQMLAVLDANRAIAPSVVLVVDDGAYRGLGTEERDALDAMARKGAGICLDAVRSLRLEVGALSRGGVKYAKVGAARFIGSPQTLTDFHSADVAAFLSRSGIQLIARDVADEAQILSLLDDGVALAQGKHIAPASPIRADLLSEANEAEPGAAVRQMTR